jgi:hypothetical protein
MAQKHPSPTFKDFLTVRQRDLARDLEQTIAGSLPLPSPLPLGEAGVRVRRLGEDQGEGAQRVAEILEA